MNYCFRCVYPEISINSLLDEEGICSACRAHDEINAQVDTFWLDRENRFIELAEKYRGVGENNYDCIIPVSGGKDSYYQTHIAKKYGLNPLLVTYHGNNYLPEGQKNLDKMRDVFDVDHLIFGPSIETLKKLNRLGFYKMGDMNWHAHAGIKIVPMIIAVKFKIPLLIWGEITWTVSGMFSPDDYVEYNKRTVLEHDLRGYTIDDFIGQEGLTAGDLNWLRLPSDNEVSSVGVRGIYIGNFFKWDPNTHANFVKDQYGFEFARTPFERTYRKISNLDDMHENGIHDYLKFIKFGYGRASDHASKDIRAGYMSREEGIKMVQKYDHIKPQRDFKRWLSYVEMSEEEFDKTADTFRDRRVWWIENGQWVKKNIWGEPSAYGKVKLDPELWGKYL